MNVTTRVVKAELAQSYVHQAAIVVRLSFTRGSLLTVLGGNPASGRVSAGAGSDAFEKRWCSHDGSRTLPHLDRGATGTMPGTVGYPNRLPQHVADATLRFSPAGPERSTS